MKKRCAKFLLSLIIPLLIILTAVGVFADNDNTRGVNAMDAINSDAVLTGYRVGSTKTVDDGYIGIPVEVTTFFNPEKGIKAGYDVDATVLVVYVVNAGFERIGVDSDVDIIKSMLDRGYIVAVADYMNDPAAVSPDLDFSLQALRGKLVSGSFYGNTAVIPAGSYHNSFVIPSGYDVAPFNVFWEIDKHGVDGTLENIVEIWNNDFRGVKGETVIKWTDGDGNRKATQTAHDGSSPVWLNESGSADENGEYIRIKHTLAVDITDCVKQDGSPIDLNLYMHVMYPTGSVEVPVLALVGSSEHHAGGTATADRPQLIGAVLNGYAGVAFDHGYTPMARNDHYGYFDGNAALGHVTGDNLTYSIQFYNSVEIGTAAMRYIRYLSLSEERFAFDLDAIGTFGNSKGGWHQFLGEPDPYSTATRRIYPGHHGETRYEAGKTETVGVIDGGEPQPWMTYGGEEISPRSNLVYCSCGGTYDAISADHSPTFITANLNDGSYYWTSNDFVNVCRSVDVPAMWFEVPLGHTFGSGDDMTYGVDVYEAFFHFAGYWLKNDPVSVEYISADMTYGGMPTYAPFTVKFTGTVDESELGAITLAAADGVPVGGFWVSAFGGTEWTYYPDNLLSNTAYTLTVPAGIKACNGIPSTEEYKYTVTTGYESVISGDGVTRVTGTLGDYYTVTVPSASSVTSFNVNKYLLRIKVSGDAVNDLGIYAVSGFIPASPDESTVGARLGTVNVNGAGYYDVDLTSVISSAAVGSELTFLVKQEKAAAQIPVFSAPNDGGISAGQSISSSVQREWATIDGNGAIRIGEFALTETYKNDVFYGNISVGGVMAVPGIIGGSALTYDDVGRRFVISLRVYDTVERYVGVFLNDCSSADTGIFDPYGSNHNFKTKANEWVTYSFTYDVYEPAEFGANGLQKKSLSIATYGFGNEVHPIYFDDVSATEIITNVTVSECSLVLSTTEQRVNPLETPYGVIPESYADTELYPFVVFDSTGKFLLATDVWGNDSGGGALGACAKQATVNNVIILRRDYTYADSTSYNNLAFVYGNVKLDLMGNTLTLAHEHGKGMFYCHAKRSNATEITVENGEIVLGSELICIAGWNTGNYNYATLVKQFNFNFNDVRFTVDGRSDSLIVNGSSDAPVRSQLVFNGCEFNLADDVPSGYTLLNLGDSLGYVSVQAIVNGGALVGGDLSGVTLASVLGKSSALTLGEDGDGEFLCQKIRTGGTLLPLSVTVDGESYTYEEAGKEGELTVYKLVANPLNTPYGEIDAAYTDKEAYPFAVFIPVNGDYYFYTAVGDFFNDATFTEIAAVCTDLVIYLRRDFTVEQSLTCFGGASAGFKYVLDLGESRLSSTAGTAISLSSGVSNLTLKGGFVINGTHPFITVGGAAESANVILDGVHLTTAATPFEYSSSTSATAATVTLVGTVVDMRGASTPVTVFAAGSSDGSVTATVTVNGGRIYLDSATNVTLTDIRGSGSGVSFGRDGGSYTELYLPSGATAPTYTVTTPGGVVGFSRLGADDGMDVYIPSDLDTPYGKIAATFASADAYPFAIFKLESDGSYTFVTAIADFFADSSVTAYRDLDADIVVYMRRDFTVTNRFTNLRQVRRGVTLDLGGRSLKANSSSQSFYVVNNGTRNGVTRIYVRFTNGTILTDNVKTFLLLGSVTSTTASATFDIYFDGVTFVAPVGNTNAYPVIEHTSAVTPFTANVVFTDCTFDMTNASTTLRLFNVSNNAGTIVTHLTVNGGEILLPSVAKFALTYYYNSGTESSFTFGESDNGFVRILLPASSAAPGYTVMTPSGEMAGFALVDTANGRDVYTLSPSVSTEHGVIPPSYADATVYPFVVFKADGSFFGAYPYLFGNTTGDLSTIAMHGARSAGAGSIILMRADWVYTDDVSYPNIGNNAGTVTLDLGGYTIYDRHTYDGGLFVLMSKPSTPNGANTLVVKNGRILMGGGSLVSFSAYNEDVDGVTLSIRFEDVRLGFDEGSTVTELIRSANPVLDLHYSVSFTDCELDLATNAPDGVKFYQTGSKDGALDITASGVSFVGSSLTGARDVIPKHGVSLYNGFLYNLYLPAIGGINGVTLGGESVSPASCEVVLMDGDVYYRLSKWIQPFGSLDELTLTLDLTLADGTSEIAEWQLGVISYVTALIAGEDAAAATLGRDMLAYIEAAYLFFAPDSLEAARISAIAREQLGEDYNSSNMPSTDVTAALTTNGLDSAALLIGSTPKFVFYPATDDSGALLYSADLYSFRIGDRTVSATTATDAKGRVYITLDTYAYEMTGTVTYTVVGTDVAGEYNLKSYLEYARTADPALLGLVERLWKYSEAALAYGASVTE